MVIGKLRRQDIKMQTFGLYGASHKTCFDIILQVATCKGVMFLGVNPNCDSSQENSAVVIFQKGKLPQFFVI